MKLQASKSLAALVAMIFFWNGTFFCSAAHKEWLQFEQAFFSLKNHTEQAAWFFNATLRGDLKGMLLAIQENRDLLNEKETEHGATALIMAAETGHYAASKILLDCGANRHAIDNNANSALMYSVMNSAPVSVDILKLFLQYGMAVNQKNKSGELPIDIAHKFLVINTALLECSADSAKKKDALMLQDRLIRRKIELLEIKSDQKKE